MSFTRRSFIKKSTLASGALILGRGHAIAADLENPLQQYVTAARMSIAPASKYRPYRSRAAQSSQCSTWVQLDLAYIHPVDMVRIFPSCARNQGGEGFPARFKIELSADPSFTTATSIFDCTQADAPDPCDHITQFPADGMAARYIRFTATQLRKVRAPNPEDPANSNVDLHYYGLALAKIDVLSNGAEIAQGCSVSADEAFGNLGDLQQLTRAPRQDGEEVLYDYPARVTSPGDWHPVDFPVRKPLSGVVLTGGLFEQSMQRNIDYLLTSFTTQQLLRQFYERAGKIPSVKMTGSPQFWEEDLAGSNAGRFLMGAGNTLRWVDHQELRARLNQVVAGIADCRQPNGYIMAYSEDSIFYSERAAYVRAWVTHGLLEAGYAGNEQAFPLLRGYYDWFNQCRYLPELLRGAAQGGQGMVANTRVSLSSVGVPADFQVVQRYFQEDAWLAGLRERQQQQIWQYPHDRPHCYLLTNLEAYFDLYQKTGNKDYLDAVEGGWHLFRENWQNAGGSISIIEFQNDPPHSNYLHQKLGELCGSSFWIFLNQRFHLLTPNNESYVAEIEKSIYNVAIANLAGKDGYRYHTILEGNKESPTRKNSCCEGQGCRVIGSLPEHIYTLASDGIYINLYEPSLIRWSHQGVPLQLEMKTRFPYTEEVNLVWTGDKPMPLKLHLRVPSWASAPMEIRVNNLPHTRGIAGSYVTIDRIWSSGDHLYFVLPRSFQLKRYTGADQLPDVSRFSIEYGPLLYAVLGLPDNILPLNAQEGPSHLLRQLTPIPGKPLHYSLSGHPEITLLPYWQVTSESFTCFPGIRTAQTGIE